LTGDIYVYTFNHNMLTLEPTIGRTSARRAAERFRPNPNVALHHQIKEDLLLKLKAAVWKAGEEIPAEPSLLAHYGVSRGTLRRAIGDLVTEGYLERFRGRGTYVCAPKLESGFAGSFGRFTVIGPSFAPGGHLLRCRRERARESVAAVLQVVPGTPIWHLERIRIADDKPAALQTSFLRVDMFPRLDRQPLEDCFLLDIMASCGVPPVRAVELVDPTTADAYTAVHLRVKPGTPLFRIERTTYAAEDRVVEFRLSLLRGDIFRYRNEFR
jgi:GntR family transcriptional regulator